VQALADLLFISAGLLTATGVTAILAVLSNAGRPTPKPTNNKENHND
jgi:hypothetical protein